MEDTIYVIEDDDNIREIIQLALVSMNYQVKTFDNAIEALEMINQQPPDLAIFDVMLPEMSGIEAIEKIRQTNQQLPILILSAKDREIDKVHGLDSGSDDYMTKPFGILELQARVRSLLRRRQKKTVKLKTPSLEIDKALHVVYHHQQILEFTKKEYQLLVYLIENQDRVVSRDELLNEIWGYDFVGESRALDVHIRALRAKLNDDGQHYIQTVRGVGYRFIEEGK